MSQFCTNCGKQLTNNASFCTNCGTKISTIQRGICKEYKFTSMHGGRCIVILDNDKLTIRRKGVRSFAKHGLKGDKTIMLKQISSIQLKEAGLTTGYIQFVIIGSQEAKGGLKQALEDENSIVFGGTFDDKTLNRNAREIKSYIEQFNSIKPVESGVTNIIKNDDKYDKLKKLKDLLDNNIIKQEEFEKEKSKLLNS